MTSSTSHLTVKPLVCGAVSAGVYQYRWPKADLGVGSRDIPMYAVGALVGSAASLTAELAHEFLFSNLPAAGRAFENTYTEGVAVAVNAIATGLLLSAVNGESLTSMGLGVLIIDSAVSQIAGDLIYDRLVGPAIDTWL
jgi:hypothetical protein